MYQKIPRKAHVLGAFHKIAKKRLLPLPCILSLCRLSVRPSAWKISAPTGRIHAKFCT